MKKYPVIITEFTKSELRTLRDLANICMIPFIDRITYKEAANKITNKFQEGQRIWNATEVFGVLKITKDIKTYIGIQIENLLDDIEVAPENSDGLIARPRDTLKMLVHNYKHQIKDLEEIESIFTDPTDDEEDEYNN